MSDEDNIDWRNLQSVTLSKTQLWRGVLLVALAVRSIAAILPNILPKTYTIATQEFVETEVQVAEAAGAKVAKKNTEAIAQNTEAVGAISVTLEGVVDGQHKQRASAEADRVTQRIRNPNKRIREYERVRQHAERNLKSKKEPLDGVDLEF